jgi:AraC-like DNA-binding protein
MEDFFKYLTPGEDDVNWGLYLNVVGKSIIQPGTIYPSINHPSGYYFSWEKGRMLYEYQIVYISEGSGVYEDVFGEYPINPGSLLILQPGKWHRYKPDFNSGWTENYVGFNGLMAGYMFSNPHLIEIKPIVNIGNREEFIDTFYRIFRLAQDEKPGFQQITAGMVMKLLGNLISIEKNLDFTEKRIEKIIEKACFLIRENIEKEIDFKCYAEENNIAYSYFRRMFKMYTGLPPAQYHLDLKIIRSKELLLSTDKIIKEICIEAGFDSQYYFSRLFKNKTGMSPSRFRTTATNQRNKKNL